MYLHLQNVSALGICILHVLWPPLSTPVTLDNEFVISMSVYNNVVDTDYFIASMDSVVKTMLANQM